MKNLYFFTRKELVESWRTSRLLILIVIFLILGLMNPLLAKLTPEIIKMTIGKAMVDEIPKPTSIDSWTQFFKNLTQIGLIVLALMFSGMVNNEVNKGTLINLVTKGLRRWVIIVGKMISLIIQWTFCFLLNFLITWGYTAYYFPDEKSPYLLQSVLPVWIFGSLLLGILLLSSTVARNSYEGLLFTGGIIVTMVLINLVEKAKNYNPLSLVSKNLVFLQKSTEFSKYLPAMLLCVFLFLLLTLLSVYFFNKKKL